MPCHIELSQRNSLRIVFIIDINYIAISMLNSYTILLGQIDLLVLACLATYFNDLPKRRTFTLLIRVVYVVAREYIRTFWGCITSFVSRLNYRAVLW